MKTSRWMVILLALAFLLNVNMTAFASPIPEATIDGTLVVWCQSEYAPVLQGLAADLLAAYGVELIVEVHDLVRDDFINAIPLGTAPDMIIIPHDQMGPLISQNYLAPISLGTLTPQFLASSIEATTIDGQIYGMPLFVESLGFFYNTDLVPVPPTTWAQVQTMGAALQASGDVTYGMALSGTTYDTYPLMTAHGGYIFGQFSNGDWNPLDLGIDNPGMIAGLQWIVDRMNDGFMSSNTDWANAHALFETGQTPFIMAGPWALDRIRASGVNYAITTFPSQDQPGKPFMGTVAMAINALSTNTAMAQTFLTEFIATESTMTAMSAASKRPSAFLPTIAKTTDPDMLTIATIAANGTPMPNIPQMGSVWGPWSDAVVLAISGQKTPLEALTEAGQQIRSLIEGFYDGMVNIPGNYQVQAGCPMDWQPNCEATALVKVNETQWVSKPYFLQAGDYEFKVALNGSWTLNYGEGGIQDGDNYRVTLFPAQTVYFTWDSVSKIVTIHTGIKMVFLPAIRR